METQATQTDSNPHADLWNNSGEAKLLESRLNGFWNADYFTKILLPLLDLKPGSRVLDVGSGTGALTLLLARHLPDVQFVGVDLTESLTTTAQTQARQLGLANVQFQEGDAMQLPFADNSFDATVCQTVLIHLSDPARAVQEMSRVLKPGGTFMAAEFHLLFTDMPIEAGNIMPDDEKLSEQGRLGQLIVKGYRVLGQGDMQLGGRVPFLAYKAGFRIADVRINDHVTHAFPPYNRMADRMALEELQGWEAMAKEPSYRAFLIEAMEAGGGTEADVEALLKLFPSHTPEVLAGQTDFAFLWLINPVLLVTIAHKP
ncbi:hypothetical protein GCM10023187_14520 [Nibrella viscosa]|uniref:Methyltransferase domain-containing protein n=1 Tax=Nibrella viscosa TaxID=1084524 RepID=A0ABP8K5H3_9BACT